MDGACNCLECRIQVKISYAEYLYSASDIKDGVNMKVEQKDVYAFEGTFPPITYYERKYLSYHLKLDKFEGHALTVKKLSIDHYSMGEKDVKSN